MSHINSFILKTLFAFCVINTVFIMPQNICSQISGNMNLPVHQKYLFDDSNLSIVIESNKNFIYENDSCKFIFDVQNKLGNDIYVFVCSSTFRLSYCDNLLKNATIDYGGYFDGGLDYYVNMKKIKPGQKISDQITLFSREFKENSRLSDFNVKLSFGYLESEKIDSIKNWYPEYTNIKTEKINDNELRTSAYVLYVYLKRITVGSLLIENRLRK